MASLIVADDLVIACNGPPFLLLLDLLLRLAVGGCRQWELMPCSHGGMTTAAITEANEDPDKVLLGTFHWTSCL